MDELSLYITSNEAEAAIAVICNGDSHSAGRRVVTIRDMEYLSSLVIDDGDN